MTQTQPWHAMEISAVAAALESDVSAGVSQQQVARLQEQYGRNVLPEGRKRSILRMFLDQFKDFLVLILLGAGLIAGVLGEVTDAIVIAAILVLNAVLGVLQERKANRAMEALKKMSVPTCEVIRDGRQNEVSSEDLVPGDLVLLREGDFIPADLRLVVSTNLRADEASLTGESAPVEKQIEPIEESLPLPDRLSMAYAGTHVSYGRGLGLVTAIGLEREIGRIAALLQKEDKSLTPLQRNLASLGKLLGILSLATCAVVFLLGVLKGDSIFGMFMTAISLAVAAIPEGLPAIVTIVLAVGVFRMSRANAIIRQLPAVESLGCASFICTDKTGTLTQNRMTVRSALTGAEILGGRRSNDDAQWLAEIGALCNDSHVEKVDGVEKRFGDPTELALFDYAEAQGWDVSDLRRRYPRISELPFDSTRKMMSTVHPRQGQTVLLVKGAPDILLEKCSRVERAGRREPLTEAGREAIHKAVHTMAASALRVLGFAYKPVAPDLHPQPSDEDALTFMGLTGMIDPARPEVRDALREATSAGIQTIMITGDNALTAGAIADDLGMMTEGDEVVTGAQLERMSDDDLERRVRHIRVFARVWPEQKLRIVESLQKAGEVVAMTGDGVNDAPALKKSDVGVAMGITGTDVAKETSDMVLADDNFATIVKAIEEGRVIFDNIRKFVGYLLACNLGEIFVIFVPILLGLGSPLFPVQILLINLVTDGLPALALGVDAAEHDVMRRRPRRPREGIVTWNYMGVVIYNAAFVALAVTCSYLIGIWLEAQQAGMTFGEHVGAVMRSGPSHHHFPLAGTMAFLTLAFDELWRAYSFRSQTLNVWQIKITGNLKLLQAIAISGLAVAVTLLWAPLREIFRCRPLDGGQLAAALGLSLVPLLAFETLKLIRRTVRNR